MNERYAQCIPFDKNVKGRIGGNPPKCIEEQIPCDYKFYAFIKYIHLIYIKKHLKYRTYQKNIRKNLIRG